MIMDSSAPRGSWVLGEVIEVFPDKYKSCAFSEAAD